MLNDSLAEVLLLLPKVTQVNFRQLSLSKILRSPKALAESLLIQQKADLCYQSVTPENNIINTFSSIYKLQYTIIIN